jgi:hypothetical protein
MTKKDVRKMSSGATSDNTVKRLDSDAKVEPRVQALIGKQLRAHHDELLRQPIPQHLVDLLKKLDEQANSPDNGESTEKK